MPIRPNAMPKVTPKIVIDAPYSVTPANVIRVETSKSVFAPRIPARQAPAVATSSSPFGSMKLAGLQLPLLHCKYTEHNDRQQTSCGEGDDHWAKVG